MITVNVLLIFSILASILHGKEKKPIHFYPTYPRPYPSVCQPAYLLPTYTLYSFLQFASKHILAKYSLKREEESLF